MCFQLSCWGCAENTSSAQHRSKCLEGESWDQIAIYLPRLKRGLRKEDTVPRRQVNLDGFFHKDKKIEERPSDSSPIVP